MGNDETQAIKDILLSQTNIRTIDATGSICNRLPFGGYLYTLYYWPNTLLEIGKRLACICDPETIASFLLRNASCVCRVYNIIVFDLLPRKFYSRPLIILYICVKMGIIRLSAVLIKRYNVNYVIYFEYSIAILNIKY